MNVRRNWRIGLLILLVIASGIVLLVPGATLGGGSGGGPAVGDATGNGTFDNVSDAPGATRGDGLTNIQYGIQLQGGARIRAPITGMMVEDLSIERNDTNALRTEIATALDVDSIDVAVRTPAQTDGQWTVEVFDANVSETAFVDALTEVGISASTEDVTQQVSAVTRNELVDVIEQKVAASALSGVSVQGAQTATGNYFVVIESVGRDLGDLRSILQERGVVDVFAYHPADNGTWTRSQVLDQGAFASIGNVRQTAENEYSVSVTVTEDDAGPFQEQMRELGFDRARNCSPQVGEVTGCLQTELNGEIIFNASWEPGLAESIASGEFVDNPTFRMTAPGRETVRNLELSLKTGQPLPAPLNFTAAQNTYLQPSLADRFKLNSVIVGLAAVLTVCLVVYYRYRDVRVAAPMVVTALSEVFLLLGFVALVQYPLNLAHIAGFIAVIGTGVDDLVIIADEILQQEGVTTGRVFRNRFRKAFWVIGAAAATTILAMSPLMVLSLGDLSGFAIITIAGVIIGVAVTRPAYGDILRNLILDE